MVLCDGLKILETNNAFCELVESEDFLVRGKQLDSFIKQSSKEAFLQGVNSGESKVFEVSIQTPARSKILKCRVKNLNRYSAFVFKDITKERSIKSELETLSIAIDQAEESVAIITKDGIIKYVNSGFEKVSGYSKEEAVGQKPSILKSGKHPDEFYRRIWECLLQGESFKDVIINKHKSGNLYYEEKVITPVFDKNKLKFFISTGRDVTHDIEKEKELEIARKRYTTIINTTSEGFWMLDKNRKIVEVNDALPLMLDYEPSEMLGKTPYDFVDEKNEEIFKSQIDRIDSTEHRKYEIELLCKCGKNVPVSISATTIKDDDGNFIFSFAFIKNIQGIKKMQKKLEELATTDRLTGAYNRLKLEEFLEEETRRAQRYSEISFSIILFDIDKFKDLNDNYGHDIGDIVLKDVVRESIKCIRDTDMFGRWGGEEFIVALPHTDIERATVVAQKLRAKIEERVEVESRKVTASFGVSQYIDGDNVDTLIKRADTRLYEAKNSGRNRVVSKE
jgi:diguanylate cyclase (GGDEF)-like protein/PAS domain S-box-containing protein